MWRSISRQVARNLNSLITNKVSSSSSSTCHFSNYRFLSNLSANITPDAQNSDSTITDDTHSESVHFSPPSSSLTDNVDTHMEMENAAPPDPDPDQLPCEGLAEEESDPFIPADQEEVDEVTEYEIDTEKLENVLSLLQSSTSTSTSSSVDDDGSSLESTLDNMDLHLHEDFILEVLQTPLILGHKLIKFFIWAVNKQPHNISLTTSLVHALVYAIANQLRKKDAYALWDLVKEIAEKHTNDVLNTDILNQLIGLFSKLGKGKAAFEVFNKFADFGCDPDSDTYYYTIEALCRRSLFDWASSACENMLNAEVLPDSERIAKIICWFCKGDKVNDAYSVYLLAKEKNKYPPQPSVNFLISVLCQKNENVKLALEMLDDFPGSTRKYAIKPFSSVIRGLCRIKDLDGAKILLSKMIDEGPPPGNAVFNSTINGYSKCGNMKEAMEMKKLMVRRGLKPDLFTYTVIMSGYASGGQMEEACKVLSEARKKHKKLSPVMYHTLIRGYCKLEQFDKALDLLAEMKTFGVQPNADEYNKLIQSLCLKALDWEKAEKLLEKMKEEGLHLNGITRGLIRAVKELEEEGFDKQISIEG